MRAKSASAAGGVWGAGPGRARRLTQEPLGFCCALIEISSFFPEERMGISFPGCGRQRNRMKHDRSCCSLFPPLRS